MGQRNHRLGYLNGRYCREGFDFRFDRVLGLSLTVVAEPQDLFDFYEYDQSGRMVRFLRYKCSERTPANEKLRGDVVVSLSFNGGR